MATIAELAGIDSEPFGRSIFRIPEDEQRLRCTTIRWLDPDLPETPGKTSNAMKEYCYTGDLNTVHQMILEDDYQETPMPYPFF